MNINLAGEVGVKSNIEAMAPTSGRFHLLSSGEKYYLYIPEIMQIFGFDESHLSLLGEPDNLKLRASIKKLITNKLLMNQIKAPSFGVETFHELEDVVVHVSQKCNLNCIYCYASDLNKVNEVMSLDVADKIVSKTLSLSERGLSSVKFLGGEPTLAWPVVKSLVNGYIDKSKGLGLSTPKFVMVTNGTKIKKDIAEFSSEKHIFTWVSLDGPKKIHDLLRPALGGQGTYDKVVASIKNLINAGVDVGIEAVYTKYHYFKGITPQNLIDHFLSLGVREIQISPTVGIWHGCDNIEDIEQISTLFSEAARHSIHSYRTKNPYLLRGIDFIIRGFISKVKHPYICGAGRSFMAINYDGEAFPCYLLESPSTSYGFLGNNWNEQRYKKVQKCFFRNGKDYHSECQKCWANEICKSCLGTSFQISNEITKPPRWFCDFQKTIIEAVLAEIANASCSQDWEIFIENISNSLSK